MLRKINDAAQENVFKSKRSSHSNNNSNNSSKSKANKQNQQLEKLLRQTAKVCFPLQWLPHSCFLAAARQKKIKTLRKKLRQIASLKEQQAEGKTLNKEQNVKVASEAQLQEELASLLAQKAK